MRRYLTVLVLLAGCDLYTGGDDEPPCAYDGRPGGGAALQVRNPETGQCESHGGGYYPCDGDDDSSCCGYAHVALSPLPDWGYCYSSCTGLDEASCLAAPGCNASYDVKVGIPEEMAPSAFTGCWAVAQSGPIQGGSCYNLDSYECSQHDDCSMFYEQGSNGFDKFAACAPEPSSQGCAVVDCGPGSHCEEQCYPCDGVEGPCDQPICTPMCVPDTDACLVALCGPGTECVTVCDGGMSSGGGTVPGQCYPVCVPVGGGDPGECDGPVACDALPPACPSGTVPGIKDLCWTGYCIPQAACGPNEPGGCEPAICATPGPACPTGTVGGTLNGCWTGYCIPQSSCPAAQCEDLTTESACTSRDDCRAVYTGDNCTCDANGCTCEDLTFARCESQLLMPW